MGDCCKNKAHKHKDTAGEPPLQVATATPGVPHTVPKTSGRQLKEVAGVTLAEVAIAAGIVVFLPIVLEKIAPSALRYVKDSFEIASKSMK
ncbi:MAG: hypothetical protein HQL06_09455 [Nitrospirae bacterium]|nr:hypothetical protein [Nitrospirota bacterium]